MRSRAISNLITVLQRKLTQKHAGHKHTQADTHTHPRSTAQHTCSVAILSSRRRERNSRTHALSWQSLLQDSPHSGTHTHTHPKNTYAHTISHICTHAHTHARTQRRTAHTHSHCDDPIPMRRSSFFFFLQFLERPTSPTQWAFQETVPNSSPRALRTFLRKSLGNRGGVRVVFCPGMGGAWTCGSVLVSVVPIGTGRPELDAVRGGRARLQLA